MKNKTKNSQVLTGKSLEHYLSLSPEDRVKFDDEVEYHRQKIAKEIEKLIASV